MIVPSGSMSRRDRTRLRRIAGVSAAALLAVLAVGSISGCTDKQQSCIREVPSDALPSLPHARVLLNERFDPSACGDGFRQYVLTGESSSSDVLATTVAADLAALGWTPSASCVTSRERCFRRGDFLVGMVSADADGVGSGLPASYPERVGDGPEVLMVMTNQGRLNTESR